MSKRHIPTVSELEAFTACARLGTTVLAARNLNLTQSAVSRSLSALEDRLGVALFDRVRRRLVLSPAGVAFLDRAEKILADLNDATAWTIAFGGSRNLLRISTLPSFGRSWLIPRLGRFAQDTPGVTFDIAARLDPVDFAVEPVDLAIMRQSRAGRGVRVVPLMEETLVVVAAPSFLEGRETLSPDDLLTLPLLQQSTRASLWLDWFRDTGADARQILRGARFDHFDMIVDAARAGLGVGLVPDLVARDALERGQLVRASDRRFATGETYALILPDDRPETPHVAAFREWLTRELAGP